MSVCISKLDSSTWIPVCAAVFEDKLVVCKKSKRSKAIYVTLFLSSEQASFRHHTIHKFHSPPVAECVLSVSPPSPLHEPPSLSSSSSPLQYWPALKLVIPSSNLESEGPCECIDPELFLQLFGADCHIPTSAVLLVGGPNGHILFCNLRSIIAKQDQVLKEREEDVVMPHLFKPLYSLDQPIMSIHTSHFPKRHEQMDPSLFVDDLFSSSSDVPNSLLILGQRGKIAVCYAEGGSSGSSKSQKFAQFVEYNIPGPILSSRLISGQCLVYSSLGGLCRIDLREESFKDAEESSPQLQLRRGPLLIPEASFKFPERVSISIPPSVLVDGQLTSVDSDPESMELEAANTGELGMTLASFKGDVCSLKTKFGGKENVSHDPEVIAKEIKRCLNSMQVTNDEISATSDNISKLNAVLIELNHVLRLLCIVKCHQEGTPCLIDNQEACPLVCAVSAGFKELGVTERELSVDVTVTYHGKKRLWRGWSLLIQVSPSSHRLSNRPNSAFLLDNRKEVDTRLATPTTVLSRCVPLEGLTSDGILEERIPLSFSQEGPLSFSVSCYLCYDPSNIITAAALDKDDSLMPCGRTVSILLNSRLLDALDFTRPFAEVPRKLHQPLDEVAAACLDLKNKSSSSIDDSLAPLHTIQLPVPCRVLESLQKQGTDEASVYTHLSSVLLPHIAEAKDKFQSGTEIRLTSYDGSRISLQLVKDRGSREDTDVSHELSLIVKSSSRSQLAEIVRCVDYRLYRHDDSPVPDPTNVDARKEDLFERAAEMKEISQDAAAILDQVTTMERFSREPSACEKAELVSKTFSLYTRLRQLPRL